MSQINRPPIGLQSLLGSKNFGQNPSELAQQVVPTVDLYPFWASQQLRFNRDTVTAVAGQGSVVETTLPQDETWGILSVAFGAEILISASDDFGIRIALDETITGTDNFVVAFAEQSNPDGDFSWVIWQPPVGFFLTPGYVIRGIFYGNNLAAKDFELHTIYYKLEV